MLGMVREWSTRVEYYSIDEFFFAVQPMRGQCFQDLAESIRRDPGAAGRAGDRGDRPDADPCQADLRRGQAGRRAGGARPRVRRSAPGRPAGQRDHRDRRPRGRRSPWGILTCLDLARADRRLVRTLLTAAGETLWWELNGEAVQPIHVRRPAHKALSRGGSFGESTAEPAVLYAWLIRNLERLIEELEYHGVAAGRLTVYLVYKNGRSGVGHATLPVPSDRFDVLLEVARPCIRKAWIPCTLATHMHLIAEDLTARGDCPLALFDPPGTAPAPSRRPGRSGGQRPTADSSSATPPRSRWPPSIVIRPMNTTSVIFGERCVFSHLSLVHGAELCRVSLSRYPPCLPHPA